MAFTETEKARFQKLAEAYIQKRRPPEHLREKIDIAFRLEGQSIEIFEIRPHFQNLARKVESSAAKATYVRSTNAWKIFLKMSDLKWHGYAPHLLARSLQEFFKVVDDDACGCFWG
jgi:hypothetical protein